MKKILNKYNQEHLINYINVLENDLKKIDFKLMKKLYINSYQDEKLDLEKVNPLKVINNINEIEKIEYEKSGQKLIINNGYGIVILAGGNATRLGLNKPKGTLKINYKGKNISLFQIYIDKLKEVYDIYKVYINVYIMTNIENYFDTKKHFEDNNYFDYPKDKIKFFVQDELPLLSVDGKILLKNKSHIWFVPNGNGNVFTSLKSNNLIKDMIKNNIKYCLFAGVDNPLINLVDFSFIGATIKNNYKLSSKTIYKSNRLDSNWVFCKYKNKPYMIDNNHLKYFSNIKNNKGEYCYREKNIIYHLIHIDYINKFSRINLKYHRAYKKYDVYDNNTFKNIDCFKFEQFIYDAFYYAKDMLLYRVNEKEFYPIKSKEDIKEVENILNHNK